MSDPLTPANPEFDGPARGQPVFRWSGLDLGVFATFFAAAVVLLPSGAFQVARLFDPALGTEKLTATHQVVFQGVLDLAIVGFIAFMIRKVHGQSIRNTLHWWRPDGMNPAFLVSFGATLAITVLLISSVFPPKEPPPIEKLLSSSSSLALFVIFGIAFAPLFEEVIFRGFLFKVIEDMAGAGAAVLATASLFALMHVPQLWGSWAGIALIFGVGYTLSMIRRQTQSLMPACIVHVAYNAMLFGMFAMSSVLQKVTGQ